MYGELTVSPLAWLCSGQPALFASAFYLYLGFTLGHWVSGTGFDLSVLFLYNIQTCLVSQALGGAVCNANN